MDMCSTIGFPHQVTNGFIARRFLLRFSLNSFAHSCGGAVFFITLITAMFSNPAAAFDKGDIIIRLSELHIPEGTAVNFNSGNAASGQTQTVKHSNMQAQGNSQAGMSISYMLGKHIALTYKVADEFKHELDAGGSLQEIGALGSMSHRPQTASLEYFFGNKYSYIRPYVGVGINKTTFEKLDLNHSIDDYISDQFFGFAKNIHTQGSIKTANSLAYTLGLNWHVAKTAWSFSTEATYIDLSIETNISTHYELFGRQHRKQLVSSTGKMKVLIAGISIGRSF